jgi:cytochrome P450
MVVATRRGNWATTSHPINHQVLRDRRFGVQMRGAVVASPMDLSFLERDPPDHTRLRRLAAPGFGPRRMAEYRPQVEQITADLVDRAAARGRFDLMADVAAALPIAVITAPTCSASRTPMPPGSPGTARRSAAPWTASDRCGTRGS